jgi:tRNA (cytidine32/uridine32-2'-O)-methyltransferase
MELVEVDRRGPRIVLARPLYAGNVGQAARAMANTGLSELVLVNPQFKSDTELRRMAKGAGSIVGGMRQLGSLKEALSDCTVVVACSARPRRWKAWKTLHPEEAATLLLERQADTSPTAILFGAEDSGLFQEELEFATHLCHIPTGPEHSSLNLAQAVLLLGWEWGKARGRLRRRPIRNRKREAAPMGQINGAIDQVAELLERVDFFRGKNKPQGLATLRQTLIRGEMTDTEIHYLRGVIAKLRWYVDNGERLQE